MKKIIFTLDVVLGVIFSLWGADVLAVTQLDNNYTNNQPNSELTSCADTNSTRGEIARYCTHQDDNVLTTIKLPVGNKTIFYKLPNKAELTITVIPCCGKNIVWNLYYRNSSEFRNVEDLPTDKPLYNYTGSETHVFNSFENSNRVCSKRGICPNGMFWITITSSVSSSLQIYTSTTRGGPLPVNIFMRKYRRRFSIKKNFTTRVAKIEWPKSKCPDNIDPLDFYLFFFVIVNEEKFYNTICGFDEANPNFSYSYRSVCSEDGDIKICETRDNNQLEIKLEQDKRYYVNVFALNTNGLSIPYARTSFEFKKFKPIPLPDGKPLVGNLTLNGGKISYKYKVKNYENTSSLFFYVIPCKGQVKIEIRHAKKVIKTETISSYTKFEIPDPDKERRYILKIIDESRGSYPDSDHVEVFATMNPEKFPMLPDPPLDFKIKIVNNNVTCYPGGKINTAISWTPVMSNNSLKYCLRVSKIQSKTHYNGQCVVEPRKVLKQNTICMDKEPTWTNNKTLTPAPMIQHKYLTAGKDYFVQVFTQVLGSKYFIPYEFSRIDTRALCK